MKRCCTLFFSCFITSRILAQHIPDPDSARTINWSDVDTLKTVEVKGDIRGFKKTTESQNIELVDERFIQQHLGGSLMQTLSRLPGVSNVGIGAGQSKPLIRGLGFNRVIVVDKGIKHEGQQWGADHGLEIDQFAIGELEVIKGPSSFMYGSDAIGGAINLKPSAVPDKNGLTGQINLIGKSNNAFYGTSIYI